ncbi:tRNA (guanosine(46)-N(7))-methyltransferase TrmB [Paraglaciecola sp. L3A3]|uniref:tRNA (guanine(46)-N(7))-methyltransferase TrmB n=1 Tax=Paraglaciecola sp. L3A3 TaxID=2686358 RepID=UPI00131AC6B5|nr:SAM-dependent methyltransferase [Paraglaciecola sp. L3A3]
MQKQARAITTNQIGIHPNLEKVVSRHLATSSQKPFSEHTQVAFKQTMQWLNGWQGPIILDSCCGVGESTTNIAASHPEAKVIGVDKSALRTDKHASYAADLDNYLIVRADLNDFLRLLVLEGIQLYKHYLLYPNPYPKSAHLQRRWYATAVLPEIIKLGGQLQVRSNWRLYIEEFSKALDIAQVNNTVYEYTSDSAMTPFERKYWLSGQQSWQVTAELPTA